MGCEHDPAQLAAYLDDELAAAQAADVRRQIAGCPACAAEVAELVRLKRAVRPARGQFAASVEFRRKIRQQIAPAKRRGRLGWLGAAIGGAAVLAAVLVVMAGTGRWALRSGPAQDAFSETADLHVNAMASANPYDVVSSDRHTVKPWFQGRIPFSFNVPELAGSEFTLLGGRAVYLEQRPGAQLIVGVRQHRISVLIFQDSAELDRAFAAPEGVALRNAFNQESWRSRGLRFVLVSDADPAGVERLGGLIRRAN